MKILLYKVYSSSCIYSNKTGRGDPLMKSNKEKIYDFIRLHADEKADRGISTAYIADAMELQRTNVSSILNLLVQEGRIQKCNGRPVLYKVGREESTLEECFSDLIGADGSLRQIIQLAKAAVQNC